MIWIIVITFFLVLIVLLINYISWCQHNILFVPSGEIVQNPNIPHSDLFVSVHNYSNIIDIYNNPRCHLLPHLDYIHVWHFNNFENSKTILFCHGNSGNITQRTYIIDACYKLHLNLLLFDYRGYGKSGSLPSKSNIRQDGEVAYEFLLQFCNSNDIIVWGESLGGHVATWIASKYSCRSLILFSTFSSLDDIIIHQNSFNILGSILSYILDMITDLMPTKLYIQNVKCPVIIIHSKEDDVIPYQCAQILQNNVQHPNKKLITINGKHSSPVFNQDQFTQLMMFADLPLQKFKHVFNVKELIRDINFMVDNFINNEKKSNLDIHFDLVQKE